MISGNLLKTNIRGGWDGISFEETAAGDQPMTDQEAVAKMQAHDISGLEILVSRYHTQALQSAYLILRDRGLAEDVAQTAFVNAFERIHTFDNSRPFRPWFLRTVLNIALKVSADKRDVSLDMHTAESGHDIPSPARDVVSILEAVETRQEILDALYKLSPAQRASIVMKYFLDLSDADAAKELDVPAGTIRRRLHDARKRLGALLNHYKE